MPFREAIRCWRDWRFWLLTIKIPAPDLSVGNSILVPHLSAGGATFRPAHTGFYSSLPFVLMVIGQLCRGRIGDRTGKRAAVC